MKRDSRLSSVLHVLLHMAQHDGPMTSDALAKCLNTHSVVIRRTLGLLRNAQLVTSERGHSGGWRISADLAAITLLQLHEALGEPAFFAIGNRNEMPACIIEQSVNAALGLALGQAETLLRNRLGEITLANLLAEVEQRRSVTKPPVAAFSDPSLVSDYTERTTRIVPGLRDLHKMAGLLLAEQLADNARILVIGAGGGMELKAFSEMQPTWRFDGIDPSAEMLALAKSSLGPDASHVTFHEGYVYDAPDGPFDAATCLLTLHFLPEEERRATVQAICQRLKPGAPFVVAHHSFPTASPDKDRWLARNAAFAIASGVPAEQARSNINAMKEHLPVLSPEQDVAIFRATGFSDIELFYAGFTFKGWIAYKPTEVRLNR